MTDLRQRRSINVSGLDHGSVPIPTASRIGPFVASGGIRGVHPGTGQLSSEAPEQSRQMFENVAAVIAAAGGHPENILKVTIQIRSPDLRSCVNEGWGELFTDPASRPARQVVIYSEMPSETLVQCDFLAVIPSNGE